MTQDSLTATAHAETPSAARYLGQLSKHFAHKITVDYTPDATPPHSTVHFPWGICRMTADGHILSVEVTADNAEGLDRIKYAIGEHLKRFAWRESLELSW